MRGSVLSFDNSTSKGRNVRKESSRNSELFDRTVPAPGSFALVPVCSVLRVPPETTRKVLPI